MRMEILAIVCSAAGHKNVFFFRALARFAQERGWLKLICRVSKLICKILNTINISKIYKMNLVRQAVLKIFFSFLVSQGSIYFAPPYTHSFHAWLADAAFSFTKKYQLRLSFSPTKDACSGESTGPW
jgi:hypothetical protein